MKKIKWVLSQSQLPRQACKCWQGLSRVSLISQLVRAGWWLCVALREARPELVHICISPLPTTPPSALATEGTQSTFVRLSQMESKDIHLPAEARSPPSQAGSSPSVRSCSQCQPHSQSHGIRDLLEPFRPCSQWPCPSPGLTLICSQPTASQVLFSLNPTGKLDFV